MKELIGKKIKEVNFDFDSREYIQFVCEGKTICYYTDGDCCSRSYFTDINGVDFLVGFVVTSVEQIELEDPPMPNEMPDECIQAYGYKMTTSGGYVNFTFHNASNGYYGGSLELTNPYGERGATPKDIKFEPLLEDFSA
jgi:hypothetical protein